MHGENNFPFAKCDGNLDIVAQFIKMGAAPCYFGGMDTKFVLDGARREAEAFRQLDLG